MTSNLTVFDRNLLELKRSYNANNIPKADFLIKRSLNDIIEKLNETSKEYPKVLNLGSRNGYGTSILANRLGTKKLISTEISFTLLSKNLKNDGIVVDEENLCFRDNSFDLIISVLNLHSINDLPGCFIQLKNILKPDGFLIASLFGERNLFELRSTLIKTEIEIYGGVSPRISAFVELKQLGSLLQRAGFNMSVIDKDTIEVHYTSPIALLYDLKHMAETNIMTNRNKKYLGKGFWTRFCENYIADYSIDQNSIIATFEILNITATK